MTKYFTCGVCGRKFHENIGDVHPKSIDDKGVCCFCKKKMSSGLWPTKIIQNSRDRWYVLWNVKRDAVAVFDNDVDLLDIDYVDGKHVTYHIPVTKENSTAFKNLIAKGGYVRSIYPVDRKPVFHWGYHKMMWAMIAKYQGRVCPHAAWHIMENRFPQIRYIICDTLHTGFACPAAAGWGNKPECTRCPLQWYRMKGEWGPFCYYEGSPYGKWFNCEINTVDKKRAAYTMMYLPLSPNAEREYTIDD